MSNGQRLELKSHLALILIALSALAATSCGDAQVQGSGQDPLGIDDIQEMENIGGDRFLVKCFNGPTEIRSQWQVERGEVCLGGHSPDDRDHDRGDRDHGRGLLCVARDNDGREPWAIGRISQGHSHIFREIVFGTLAQCERSLQSSQLIGRPGFNAQLLLCATRDSDGRDPWALWSLDSNSGHRQNMVYDSFEQCRASLAPARRLEDSVLLCASRDSDGRDPYAIWRLSPDMRTTPTGLVYGTIAQCGRALDRAQRRHGEMIICASRDRDGRDPYSLFSVTEHHETATQFSYSSFDECAFSHPGH